METEILENTFEAITTGVNGAGDGDAIFISQKAIGEIKKISADNNVPENFYLRFDTRGGGCSGMNYMLGFDGHVSESDRTYEIDGIKIVIDAKSLFYLMGISVDYTDNEQGKGFIFNSPNQYKTCGCHG